MFYVRAFLFFSMPKYLTILCFVCVPLIGYGQKYFQLSPAIQAAYHKVIALKLEEAQVELDMIKVLEPDNLLVYHIENYIDFFRVFIGEKSEDYERFKSSKKLRLTLIKQGPDNDPFYLFSQAEVLLQSALLRLKFEEYFGAFNDVSKAYEALEYNTKRFPDFIANRKSLGILHAMVGSIPESFRWGVKILGMDGTIAQGKEEIESVLSYAQTQPFLFVEETIAMYAYVLLHLSKEPETAWETINRKEIDPKVSLLACFVKANIALRTGRTEAAITILSQKPIGIEYYVFPQLEYMKGLAKLYQLDKDAKKHFEEFLKWFKGRNYIKDTYQKLAWYDLIFEHGRHYETYMSKCAKNGYEQVDEDKSAMYDAQYGDRPSVPLLKARLLFDGGYYERSLQILKASDELAILDNSEGLEWRYRLGRNYHALKRYDLAIESYKNVLTWESRSASYMVANAALQLGMIYETQRDYRNAEVFFRRCLELHPDRYASSLNQKARAGLDRVKASR